MSGIRQCLNDVKYLFGIHICITHSTFNTSLLWLTKTFISVPYALDLRIFACLLKTVFSQNQIFWQVFLGVRFRKNYWLSWLVIIIAVSNAIQNHLMPLKADDICYLCTQNLLSRVSGVNSCLSSFTDTWSFEINNLKKDFNKYLAFLFHGVGWKLFRTMQ